MTPARPAGDARRGGDQLLGFCLVLVAVWLVSLPLWADLTAWRSRYTPSRGS